MNAEKARTKEERAFPEIPEREGTDLKLTSQEVENFAKAFKDPTFCNMFQDYVNEIQSPAARALREREIEQLERERGSEVTWVHPVPRFCISVQIKRQKDTSSSFFFVNFAASDAIEELRVEPGKAWQIPHAVVPCTSATEVICDVVFHPTAFNNVPQKILVDSAFDSIEKLMCVEVTRTSVQFCKGKEQKYIGTPKPSVIRRRVQEKDNIVSNIKKNNSSFPKKNAALKIDVKVPEYTVVHREQVDFQDYTSEKTKVKVVGPRRLYVRVNYPNVSSSEVVKADVEFDKSDPSVLNIGPVKPLYTSVQVKLPYPVDETTAAAQWHPARQVLEISCIEMTSESKPKSFDSK